MGRICSIHRTEKQCIQTLRKETTKKTWTEEERVILKLILKKQDGRQ
jgi:hypothetical protein